MRKTKIYYWAEFDLDGSFEFYRTKSENEIPAHYAHLLGPFVRFKIAKAALIHALRDCKNQLSSAIMQAKMKKAEEVSDT